MTNAKKCVFGTFKSINTSVFKNHVFIQRLQMFIEVCFIERF